MYACIRRYVTDPENVEELVGRVRDTFVPFLSETPGFISYQVIDAGRGILVSVSVFETLAAASLSNEIASDWVRNNLALYFYGMPDITAGEIILQAP